MLKPTVGGWTGANALGFCLAFLSFLLGGAIVGLLDPGVAARIDPSRLPSDLDPTALPDWLDRATYEAMYRAYLLQHVISLAGFGVIIGTVQALTLRPTLPRPWPWVLMGIVGFTGILALETVERHFVIGPHAGPLEPIMIALGGGGLAGFFQWLYLRRRAVDATRWLLLWIAGLAAGIVTAALVLTAIGFLLRGPVNALLSEEAAARAGWVVFFAVYGAVVGAVAGRISAPAILAALKADSGPGPGSARRQ